MLKSFREWKYSHIVRGMAWTLFGILELVDGGGLKWLIAIALFIVAFICFFEKMFIKNNAGGSEHKSPL